ncbi:MAG TPA: carbon starvation CstA family protein [Pirellulales bacterium]|nr:carbon starvation CstA family protein [Pirellulales bacterium]
MTLLTLALVSAAVLIIAYFTYGRVLARLFELDPNRKTPAVALRDDVDYSPIEPKFLLGQHFSAIAAAGPIVGPILAGLWFGWVPAVLWILIGAIFIGGVHDLSALVASIRHKARSIAEVVREHMSERSYLMFLSFIWIALVYIIVAFTDITAAAFIGGPEWKRLGQEAPAAAADSAAIMSERGGVTGGAIATSSLLYLALPIIMGLLLRYTRLSLGVATIVFLPLVGVTIWIGQYMPLDLGLLVQSFSPELSLAEADQAAHKIWDVILLGYCLIAGAIPVWLLLQPRGHLGGYFLYAALIAGGIGVLFGGFEIQYADFKGWDAVGKEGEVLFPFLFITIACGACSGFHSLIASGTTSKQLRKETDARPIGYGAMLLEAMVAVLALATVMILSPGNSNDATLIAREQPNIIYANGLGQFLSVTGVPLTFAVAFGLMAFTTFVYDTLDVCTRLGRFIVQELTGWHDAKGRWLGTTLTAGVPLFFVLQKTVNAQGQPVPAWRTFWTLFGASNQLLAALTLLGVTVWLWRTRRARWVWAVTGIPTALMYTMSTWALVSMTWPKFQGESGSFQLPTDPVAWAGVVLVALAAMMLVEAIRVIVGSGTPPRAQEALAAQPAG